MTRRLFMRVSIVRAAVAVMVFVGLLLGGDISAHAQHTGGSYGGSHWHGGGGGYHGSGGGSYHRSGGGSYHAGSHGGSGGTGRTNPWGLPILALAIAMIVLSRVTRFVVSLVDEALATRAPRWRHEFRHCRSCRTISSSRAPACPGCGSTA